MGQDFPRTVEGYDIPFFTGRSAQIQNPDYLEIYRGEGPGEIYSIKVAIQSTDVPAFNESYLEVVTDGVSRFSSTIYALTGAIYYTPFWGSNAAVGKGTEFTNAELNLKIPYKSSVAVRFRPASALELVRCYMFLAGREGS